MKQGKCLTENINYLAHVPRKGGIGIGRPKYSHILQFNTSRVLNEVGSLLWILQRTWVVYPEFLPQSALLNKSLKNG